MERDSKKIIRVINTHLDHTSSDVRHKELDFVMRTIQSESMVKESVTFLAGDFNAEPQSLEMRVMESYPQFKCLTQDIGMTYHGYFKDEYQGQLDYMYARGNVRLKSVEKWTDEHHGVYLSDHYPVLVTVETDYHSVK